MPVASLRYFRSIGMLLGFILKKQPVEAYCIDVHIFDNKNNSTHGYDKFLTIYQLKYTTILENIGQNWTYSQIIV